VITLLRPDRAHLPAYVAALRGGWSASTTRDISAEQLAEIAADAALFLRTQRGEGPGKITLADGTIVDRLPGEVFWVWDGEFCGAINLRYLPGTEDLPPYVSGHAGYSIIPAKQRRGYATEALRRLLPVARAAGLRRLSITCDTDNLPSRRVIEANGGVPATSPDDDKLLFWITLEGPTAMASLPETIDASVAAWSGITPPNDPGRRMAADLAKTIAAFEALRGTLQFEDEPSSFTAALQATKE
jgi:predicted acetyltransferase